MTFEAIHSKEASQLEADLQGLGATVALCRHPFPKRGPEAAAAVARAFGTRLFGARPKLDKLHLLDPNMALEKASHWLSVDVVSGDPRMPPDEARRLALRFVSMFAGLLCLQGSD
jgi:hypothetical protein